MQPQHLPYPLNPGLSRQRRKVKCLCQSPLLRLLLCLSALLVRDGLSSSKHAGLRSLFNRQYVKTGKIPKDLARIYNDLFERRQEGECIDFVSFQESLVLPWVSKAEAPIGHVARLIENEAS
ncbi:MAG: HEPN domain-containing protein [Syntrophobacteraceae bacterium]